MRYHFIVLIIAIHTTIHGMPPQLNAAGINAQSPSIQTEHLEDNDTHANTTPYRYLHRESQWPTCWEMIECLQGCCNVLYILTTLCIQDAYKEHKGHQRTDYYERMQERRDK